MGVLRMGSLKQVYSFILLSAHVEVDLTLVISERICAVNEALENSQFFLLSLSVWKHNYCAKFALGLHDAIVMHVSSVKPVLWLEIYLHHLFSDGAAFTTQSLSSLTSYAIPRSLSHAIHVLLCSYSSVHLFLSLYSKRTEQSDLMKGLSHTVLSVLVRLTDTVLCQSIMAQNTTLKTIYAFYNKKFIYLKTTLFYPEDLSFHIVMWPR